MKCPQCGEKTQVLGTREEGVRRRRECLGPRKHRFTTREVTIDELTALRSAVFKLDSVRRLLKEELEDAPVQQPL